MRVLQKAKNEIIPFAKKLEAVRLLEERCIKEDGRISYVASEILAEEIGIKGGTMLHWLRNKWRYGSIDRRKSYCDPARRKVIVEQIRERCIRKNGKLDQSKAHVLASEVEVSFGTLKCWYYLYIKTD
jgi:hypothetical protein